MRSILLTARSSLIFVATVLASCSDPTSESAPISPSGVPAPGFDVGPACLPGCTETDQNPDKPGVFLSTAVTPNTCRTGTDHDQDGLSSRCENDLAAAFAPYMRHHSGDNVDRQGYWAARPIMNGQQVQIIYMFGYYVDEGVQGNNDYLACKAVTFWEVLGECDGHSGDSEWVVLNVYYNGATEHWLLDKAVLSHHLGKITASRGVKEYPTGFAYSRRLGADPIIWVAQGKHANYPSQSACDAGNGGGYLVDLLFSFDTCGGNNLFFRASTGGPRNIGSNGTRLLNCVASQDPFHQDPVRDPECFWTAQYFFGWQIDQTTHADGYKFALKDIGFIP